MPANELTSYTRPGDPLNPYSRQLLRTGDTLSVPLSTVRIVSPRPRARPMNGGEPHVSLTTGLRSPHSPLRRFLDRELSARAGALRQNFRAQHRAEHILLPPPGVGSR